MRRQLLFGYRMRKGRRKKSGTGGVLPIADCRLPIADCRLPIADCRLPIADCRLPIADCRFYGNSVCGQVILVGLCHVFSSCIMPMTSATDKSHYTHKNPNIKFFCKKLVIPAPAYAGAGYGGNQLAAGRRMLRRLCRRELDGDFISPSFSRLRESTLLPFCYLRESANGDLSPKMANPLRRQSRPAHSRIFPSCFARWFALRANGKNAAIIAYAIMTAPKARLDSRRSLPPRRRGRE